MQHALLRALALIAAATVACAAAANPPVRAVTAFIDLEPTRYEQQLAETASRLRQAQKLLERGGFSVQTLRITTQPFARYVAGMSREQALAVLSRLGRLAKDQGVLLNIGPAALDDHPDPEALALLEEVQSRGEPLNSSMIIAAEDGVHWNAVRASRSAGARAGSISTHCSLTRRSAERASTRSPCPATSPRSSWRGSWVTSPCSPTSGRSR